MITGSLVAIVTPMHEDGRLDLARFKNLIDWHVSEGTDGIVVVGTTGASYTDSTDGSIKGAKPFDDPKASPDPYVQEHIDLIASIKAGKPLNEGKQVAESTLTAIMGRMSAYTGRQLSWDWVMNASKLDIVPAPAFGPGPKLEVPVPGVTPLV